jgi:uncharacterized protein YecE (DUF72 family)
MRLAVGTSGFSYKEWKGVFYPEDLPASQYLRYYGERFPSVEINNTFYKMPNRELVAKWADEVPENFIFVLKASQRITHMKRLKEANSEVEYFYKVAEVLGSRLGPTLFQLPPFAKKDAERLKSFLDILPPSARAAFEFRHASWFDEEIYSILREKNAALAVSDEEEQKLPNAIIPTANFGYLRLRRCDYDGAALNDWKQKITAQTWGEAFVYFKHEDEGTGPKLAADFIAIPNPPQQGL